MLDIPHICHEHHERRSCKFFLAGVNFYRFNAKNWRFFTDSTREIGVFFTDLSQKIGVFRCKFYSPKIMPVLKKMTNIRYAYCSMFMMLVMMRIISSLNLTKLISLARARLSRCCKVPHRGGSGGDVSPMSREP